MPAPEEEKPKNGRFRFAVALHREGKKSLASKQVEQLLTECPEHAKAWALKSTMERESRKAVATAEKGYAARPDLAATRRALCAALTRLDFEEQGSKKRTSFAFLARAAQVCPEDPKAQFRLGRAARQLKDVDTARKAFRATLALDPRHERAAFWLAALGDGRPPSRAPVDHLKALYDDYAPRYDDHLSKTLESKAPELVAAALAEQVRADEDLADEDLASSDDKDDDQDDQNDDESSSSSSSSQAQQQQQQQQRGKTNGEAPSKKKKKKAPSKKKGELKRGIDLGCGTGLSGSALVTALAATTRKVAWRGVDLSPRMCELATKRGLYADVRSVELLDALRDDPPYDFFVSCDVLVYFGDLDPFFAAAACNAAKHAAKLTAYLAMTLEDGDDADHGWDLTATGRFRHAPQYVLDAAKNHRWRNVTNSQSVLRRQSGKPVLGRIYVFAFDTQTR